MSAETYNDVTASVRQRLLNRSRSDNRPFNELLQYYAMERFLYRLSQSQYANDFILKGGLLLRVWHSPEIRPTMDIDMLGKMVNEESGIIALIKEIISLEVEPDGLDFAPDSVRTERIIENAGYKGLRILLNGSLGTARINIQIDIGFDDVVFPCPEENILPSVLNFSAPRLICYSRESVIAEKFEVMVKLGELNSRMKDFYDIWLLSRCFDFEGPKLTEAIRLTFQRRGTEIPIIIKIFSEDFIALKQVQWSAFRKRLQQDHVPDSFTYIIKKVDTFLSPLTSAFYSGAPFSYNWTAPGPWE